MATRKGDEKIKKENVAVVTMNWKMKTRKRPRGKEEEKENNKALKGKTDNGKR